MSLDGKVTAYEIVRKAGMAPSPEYYSGRGATSSDLNSGILDKIFQGVNAGVGAEAAGQFVQMVAGIPKLSATDFLLTLYRLEGNEWQWGEHLLGGEKGMYLGSTDEKMIPVAFATMVNGFSGMSDRDETASIRGEFLVRHGVKPSEPSRVYLPFGR